jgi:hypothetical protein
MDLAEEGSKAVVVEAACLQRQRIFGVMMKVSWTTVAMIQNKEYHHHHIRGGGK